jgi:ribosomal protein S27AE
MTDNPIPQPGQVCVQCPHCSAMAVTGSRNRYRCGYCGYNFKVESCIVHGHQHK